MTELGPSNNAPQTKKTKKETYVRLTTREKKIMVNVYNYLEKNYATYPYKDELYQKTANIMEVSVAIVRKTMGIYWKTGEIPLPKVPSSGKRNTSIFKDKLILLCSDQDTFLKFWDRVCTLAGANTRVVNEDDLNMTGALVVVTELDCPHEVQNKANQDNIPLVSTHWVNQCLIEAKIVDPNGHAKFSFAFTEQE